jgi:hypothetical protein
MQPTIVLTNNYGLGTLSQIMRGEFVHATADLPEMKERYKEKSAGGGLLISPMLIGVYRRALITSEGAGMAKVAPQKLEEMVRGEVANGVHGGLIQIGYSPDIWGDAGYIRDSLGGEQGRIKVLPYEKLASEGEAVKNLSTLSSKRLLLRENPDTSQDETDFRELVKLSRQILASEGLTRNEHALLRGLEKQFG